MRTYKELDLNNFEFWQGAINTFETIQENNKVDDLENLLDELYPNGLSETELNDLLWFEEEWLFEMLCINDDDDNDE